MTTIVNKDSFIYTGNGTLAKGVMTIAINKTNVITAPVMEEVVSNLNHRNQNLMKRNTRLEMGHHCFWPIDQIEIPDFQREHNETKISRMVKDGRYKNEKEDIKKAFYNPATGKAVLLDGYHTYDMRKDMGVPDMELKMYPLMSYEEAAFLFASQHEGTTRLASYDQFKALLAAKDHAALDIEKAFKEAGVSFKKTKPNELILRNVNSIRKVQTIYNAYGYEGLLYTLKLPEAAEWENQPSAYIEASLNIGYTAYPYAPVNSQKYYNLIKVMKSSGGLLGFIATAVDLFKSDGVMHGKTQSLKSYVLHIVKD